MVPSCGPQAALLYIKHSVDSCSVIHKFSLMVGQKWCLYSITLRILIYHLKSVSNSLTAFKKKKKISLFLYPEEFVQAVQSTAGMAIVLLIKSVMGNGDSIAVMVSCISSYCALVAND